MMTEPKLCFGCGNELTDDDYIDMELCQTCHTIATARDPNLDKIERYFQLFIFIMIGIFILFGILVLNLVFK